VDDAQALSGALQEAAAAIWARRRRLPMVRKMANWIRNSAALLTGSRFGEVSLASAFAAQVVRNPMRNAPQCRPRTRIGEDRSFISTKLPPPMSRR
jgi:hypothetical protein